jgi:predicted O-methyltransferase YrrM
VIVVEKVQDYLDHICPPSPDVLAQMERYGHDRGFPLIGPLVGRLLAVLARSISARRVFECGSGFGYSAHWFAEAVGPEGEVFLTDGSEENLDLARSYLGRAGLSDRCRFLPGDAMAGLKATEGPFDVILVDIDKEGYPASLATTVPKLRPGGLLITDNLLWSGRVAEPDPDLESTRAIQEYNLAITAHPALETVILPLRDGVGISRKREREGDSR